MQKSRKSVCKYRIQLSAAPNRVLFDYFFIKSNSKHEQNIDNHDYSGHGSTLFKFQNQSHFLCVDISI